MATISNTPRPAYAWDSTDNVWYPIGTGAHSHNEIDKTTINAKGDLIVGTANDAYTRQAVGADGSALIADSTQTTGVNWAGDMKYAGKNKIINGDFSVWQRGTSFGTNGVYSADRWNQTWNGSPTLTVSRQAFTPGTAPVAGYEAPYFMRLDVTSAGTGATYLLFAQQRVEDVRTFAGQTVTFSFWAKSSTSSGVGVGIRQNFGSGGSAEVYPTVTDITGGTTTSSWRRLIYNITFPSISGKTIGTGSYISFDIYSGAVNTVHQIDIWGTQAEVGSVATPFVPAGGGSQQAELALCQRYYTRFSSTNNTNGGIAGTFSWNAISTSAYGFVPLPVTMRVAPTAVDYSNLRFLDPGNANYNITAIALAGEASPNNGALSVTTTGLASGKNYYMYNQGSVNGYLGFSAEL